MKLILPTQLIISQFHQTNCEQKLFKPARHRFTWRFHLQTNVYFQTAISRKNWQMVKQWSENGWFIPRSVMQFFVFVAFFSAQTRLFLTQDTAIGNIWHKQSNITRLQTIITIILLVGRNISTECPPILQSVFERLVAMAKCLGRQNLAFAGTDSTSGNSYELAQMISEFDAVMEMHLKSNARNKYLTPEAQNDLIKVIGDRIRNTI